jgi:hypothetical protein
MDTTERPVDDFRLHGQQPWTLAMLKALEDGPKPYLQIVGVGIALVPPGRAYRKWLYTRNKRRPSSVRLPRRPDDRQVMAGARHLVADNIAGLRQQGRIETYVEDGVKMIRIVRGQKIRRATSRSADMKRFFHSLAPGTLSARDLRDRWDTYDNFIKRIPRDQLPYEEIPYGRGKWNRRYKLGDVEIYEQYSDKLKTKRLGEPTRTHETSADPVGS